MTLIIVTRVRVGVYETLLGQWRSWQKGRFEHPKTRVRIHAEAFFIKYIYFLLTVEKDKNKEKGPEIPSTVDPCSSLVKELLLVCQITSSFNNKIGCFVKQSV